MPGKPVRVGPFNNGLNNVSLSGESKDTELVEMVNFEVGPDNLLWSRPPYRVMPGTTIDGSTVDANWKVLGVYRTTTTEWYVIALKPKPGGASDLVAYLMGDFTIAPIVIKAVPAGNEVTAFVQMNADCYFCVSPSSLISSFKWTKGGATTDIAAMKKGFCMIAFKSRLWIAGIDTASLSSRLYFSAIGVGGPTPDVWNAVDFADIAPGEGGFITALLALNSSIMIFKNDGTWRYSYPSSPAKGQVDKISGYVGAATSTSVVEFENYVYVYDQGRLYELVSSTFTQLNRFLRFEQDTLGVDGTANGVDISVVNRRLIVRYFNNIYAYSIDTRSWSQWRSYIGTPGKLFELPADSSQTTSSTFIAASAGTTQSLSANLIPAFTDPYKTYINSLIGPGNSVTLSGSLLTVNTFKVNSTSEAYLNDKNGPNGFNLRISSGQKLRLTGTMNKNNGNINIRLYCKLIDGTVGVVTVPIASSGPVDKIITAMEGTIAAYLVIAHTVSIAAAYNLTGMQLTRVAVDSPATIIAVKDEYNPVPVAVEYIKAYMRTKSYDFQLPSGMKKLFWWGADVKTNQPITTKLIPTAIKLPPTWGALRAYTHNQLRAGTWGNPLSFLQTSLDVVDGGDPANAVTENGRIFVKLIKAIRFKQLSFYIELTTLGTQATGPCKVHTITAYVMPKEKVVDKFN